jgi:AraC-like DNA-binding protein
MMRAKFEKIGGEDRLLHVFERAEPTFPFHWHYHPEFELTLILEGSGQRLIGDSVEEYVPGDLVLLGSNIPHTYHSGPVEGKHRALVFQFRPGLLGESFLALPEMKSLRLFLAQAAYGLSFRFPGGAQRAAISDRLCDLPSRTESAQVLGLLGIFDSLAHDAVVQPICEHNLLPTRVEDQQRIHTICALLCKNYHRGIDYQKLSEKLNLSQASLCRLFRRSTGKTMTDYVNEYRISMAAQLLKETDKSMLEIAFEVGFGNYSHFNRQFKKSRGKTPRIYRATFAGQAD